MNKSLITPEHSKTIARRLFLNAFPESGGWFDLAWKTALSRPPVATESKSIPDKLQIADTATPAVKEMAREFAVLFETFLQKFPVAQEALIERLGASCLKFGKSERSMRHLKEQLEKTLKQEPPFLVWTAGSSQLSVTTEYISHEEAEAYIARQGEFDIFINVDTVLIKNNGKQKSLALPPRLYWLFIMFLRYRNRPLPPGDSFRRAWDILNPRLDENDKTILQK